MSDTSKDYDNLRSLIIKHVFLGSCNVKLSQFLLEKDPKSLDEITLFSDRFLSAHDNEKLNMSDNFPLIANASFSDKNKDQSKNYNENKYHSRSRSVDTSRPRFTQKYQTHDNNHNRYNNNSHSNSSKYSKNYQKDKKLMRGHIKCYKCNGMGHVESSCPSEFAVSFSSVFNWREKKNFKLVKPESLNAFSTTSSYEDHHIYDGFLGKNNPRAIKVLRDTGSMVHAVHRDLIHETDMLGESINLITFGGNKESFPLAKIFVDTPFITGYIIVCVIQNYPDNQRVYDVLIGNGNSPSDKNICLPTLEVIDEWERKHKHINEHNIELSYKANDNDTNTIEPSEFNTNIVHTNQVTTRAQAKTDDNSTTPSQNLIDLDISDSDFIELQKEDISLNRYFKLATSDDKLPNGEVSSKKHCFKVVNGKLVRICISKSGFTTQLAVPKTLRNKILSLSHDTPLYAHGGRNKTYFMVSQSFFWPGMSRDVKLFCKSCDTCQRTTHRGRKVKAPLQIPDKDDITISCRPFQRISMDIIGELPMTKNKNRFILTIIDSATRWTEAIPLRNCDTVTVSEALCTIFSRFGFPREILSDNGPQFTSVVMKQVMSTLGIKHKFSTPYHPQANGLCERVNSTIKANLRKAAFGSINDWDRLLPITLFNIRSSPQETTKYTPFELVYGFTPKSLHTLIKDSWLEDEHELDKPLEQYVIDLRTRILKTCSEANKATHIQQSKSKDRYDKSSKLQTLKVGDKVLLLLSKSNCKLEKQWQGPYNVVEIISPVNYKIMVNNKPKVFHINMLQKYYKRHDSSDKENEVMANVGIVYDDDSNNDDCQNFTQIETPSTQCNETWENVSINADLNKTTYTTVKRLLYKHRQVFSDIPGTTDAVEHNIELSHNKPIKLKPYPLPLVSHDIVAKEVDNMLNMGIIKRSNSPYAAPIVLVKKKDGKIRFCIDYRKLNAITIGDATPVPDPDLLFSRLHEATVFTKLDFTKGYW